MDEITRTLCIKQSLVDAELFPELTPHGQLDKSCQKYHNTITQKRTGRG